MSFNDFLHLPLVILSEAKDFEYTKSEKLSTIHYQLSTKNITFAKTFKTKEKWNKKLTLTCRAS